MTMIKKLALLVFSLILLSLVLPSSAYLVEKGNFKITYSIAKNIQGKSYTSNCFDCDLPIRIKLIDTPSHNSPLTLSSVLDHSFKGKSPKDDITIDKIERFDGSKWVTLAPSYKLYLGESTVINFKGSRSPTTEDLSVDLIPSISKVDLSKLAWWNTSYSYRYSTNNTDNNQLIYPFVNEFACNSVWYGQNGSLYTTTDSCGRTNFAFANTTSQRFGASTIIDGAKNQQITGTAPSSLKGYWTLDNDNAKDISGNGNDGTVQNFEGDEYGATGQVSQAYDFDGTDDYVNLNVDPSYNSGTITMWIKPDNAAGSTDEKYMMVTDGGGNHIHMFNYNNGNSYWGLQIAGTYYRVTTSDSFPSGTSDYFMVTLTWDISSNYLEVFWNDVSKGTASPSETFSIGYNAVIGGENDAGTIADYTSADIDDVRIYDRALSSDEIQALYDAGSGASDPTFGAIESIASSELQSLNFSGSSFGQKSTGVRTFEFVIYLVVFSVIILAFVKGIRG